MEHRYPEFVLGAVGPVGMERIGDGVRGGDHHSAVGRVTLDVFHQRGNAVVVDYFHRSQQPPALERQDGEAFGFLGFGFGLVGRGLSMQQLAEGLGDVEQTQIVQKIQHQIPFGVLGNQHAEFGALGCQQFQILKIRIVERLLGEYYNRLAHGPSVTSGRVANNNGPSRGFPRRHLPRARARQGVTLRAAA